MRVCRLLLLTFQDPGTIHNPTQAGDEDIDGDAHAREEKDRGDGKANRVRDIGKLGAWLHNSTLGPWLMRRTSPLQPFTSTSIP
jgi:hypothetical protein